MKPEDFTKPSGKLLKTPQGLTFLPNVLPPAELKLDHLLPLIARATKALGELSGIGRTLQNPYLLVQPFMRREAVASSKIEGTVTTLTQLFLFEVDKDKETAPDAREVYNYVRALQTSLDKLDELPVSARLIKEAHKILLSGLPKHRGAAIIPGEYKKEQNWIGARLMENARYVPPPPKEADDAMAKLEKFINEMGEEIPLVVNLALIHYQFEAIHPFPDGNGRVGRLLIPLVLCARQEISQPLLYLSSYFEKHYDDYIDKMLAVSQKSNWTEWVQFFLEAIEETSKEAIETTQKLQDLQTKYRGAIQRARSSALLGQLLDLLFERPTINVPVAAEKLNITYNAAKNNINKLVELKILEPFEMDVRPKIYLADEILELLA